MNRQKQLLDRAEDVETSRIKVYREDEEWGKVSRWFLMRADKLRELYVETWTFDVYKISPREDAHVRAAYDFPVVLVYLD